MSSSSLISVVRGRVVDETGKPVVDARVIATRRGIHKPIGDAITDESGAFACSFEEDSNIPVSISISRRSYIELTRAVSKVGNGNIDLSDLTLKQFQPPFNWEEFFKLLWRIVLRLWPKRWGKWLLGTVTAVLLVYEADAHRLIPIPLSPAYILGRVFGRADIEIDRDFTIAAGQVWRVPRRVHIQSGVTLTIDKGATLNFASNTGLVCEGNLAVNGEPDAHVKFTGDPGWGNIAIITEFSEDANQKPISPARANISYADIANGSGMQITHREFDHRNDGWIENWHTPGGGWQRHGGGILIVGSNVTLDYCSVTRCRAYYGSGIEVRAPGKVLIQNCRIEQNTADKMGGGIFLFHTDAEITNSTICGNTVKDRNGCGGGVYVGTDSPALVEDDKIDSNVAGRGGGGIYAYDTDYDRDAGGKLRISDNEVANNCIATAPYDSNRGGGGLRFDGDCLPVIQDNVVRGNIVFNGNGGGVFLDHEPAELTGDLVYENSANQGHGGGYYFSASGPWIAEIYQDGLVQKNTSLERPNCDYSIISHKMCP